MNHLSLFTGAGGGELGALLLGWKTIGYVEIDDYCQQVLAQRIKDGILHSAPIFTDIKALTKEKIDFAVNLCYRSRKILEDDMGAHRKNYDEAVNMYDKGLSIQDVANYYGITRQAMHKILSRRGVLFRNNLKHGKENHFFRGGVTVDNRTQDVLEQAVIKGIVTRKTHCEKCNDTGTFKDGRTKIQAHHSDYNKPLEVEWLCQKCHHEWHKYNKAIERKEDVLETTDGYIDVISAGFP